MLKVCQIFIIIFHKRHHPAHLLHNLLVLLVFLLQHVVHLIPKPPCRAQPNWTVDTLLSLSLPSYPPALPSPRPPFLPSQSRHPLPSKLLCQAPNLTGHIIITIITILPTCFTISSSSVSSLCITLPTSSKTFLSIELPQRCMHHIVG